MLILSNKIGGHLGGCLEIMFVLRVFVSFVCNLKEIIKSPPQRSLLQHHKKTRCSKCFSHIGSRVEFLKMCSGTVQRFSFLKTLLQTAPVFSRGVQPKGNPTKTTSTTTARRNKGQFHDGKITVV